MKTVTKPFSEFQNPELTPYKIPISLKIRAAVSNPFWNKVRYKVFIFPK